MQQTVQHRDNTMSTLKDAKAYIALTDALKYNNNNKKPESESKNMTSDFAPEVAK